MQRPRECIDDFSRMLAADVINGATILKDGGMLPGVLDEPGIEPFRHMLAAAGEGGGGRGD